MGRPLAPCGTEAAYRRHRLRGEEACVPCRDAANAANRARLDGDRSTRSMAVLTAVAPSSDEPVDVLADARENLRLVTVALEAAIPREVAPLSKRRQELVAHIAELERGDEKGLGDELAAFRRRRSGA